MLALSPTLILESRVPELASQHMILHNAGMIHLQDKRMQALTIDNIENIPDHSPPLPNCPFVDVDAQS